MESQTDYISILIQSVHPAIEGRNSLFGEDQRVREFAAHLTTDETLREMFRASVRAYLLANTRSALFFADKLRSLIPESPLAIYWLAACQLADGDGVRAAALLEKLSPLHDSFAVLAGRALLRARQFEAAARTLAGEAREKCGDAALLGERRRLLGEAKLELESIAEAEKAFVAALHCDPSNIAAFNALNGICAPETIASLPPPSQNWLPSFYRPTEAETSPSLERLRAANDSDVWLAIARAKLFAYDLPAARESCLAAMRTNPFHLETALLYGELLAERRQTAELFSLCARLVEQYAEHPITLHLFGIYYALLGRPETATRLLTRATQGRRSLPGLLSLGHALTQQEETEQALGVYRTAARLFPFSPLPPLCVGIEYGRANNARTALLSLEQAQRIDAFDPFISNELGCALLKERRTAEAKRAFISALTRCSADGMPLLRHSLLHNLAVAHRRLQEHGQSVHCLEEALKLRADEPAALFALAFGLHLSGQLSRAALLYHRVLALHHETHFADIMLRNCLADAADRIFEAVNLS